MSDTSIPGGRQLPYRRPKPPELDTLLVASVIDFDG